MLRRQRKVAESVWRGMYKPEQNTSSSDVFKMVEKMSIVIDVLEDLQGAEHKNIAGVPSSVRRNHRIVNEI